MKISNKTLKVLGFILAFIATAVSTNLAYDNHQANKKKEAELTFASKKSWQWHDEYSRIQIRFFEETGRSILRKVDTRENYVIYAKKNDDYELETMAKFITKCKPNTAITTSKKYSNGEPIILQCTEEGDALSYSVKWPEKDTDIVWHEDIDGFKIYTNFGNWDFTKLDQEITLSKAE